MANRAIISLLRKAALPFPELCEGDTRLCISWANSGQWFPTTEKLHHYPSAKTRDRTIFFFLLCAIIAAVYMGIIELLRLLTNFLIYLSERRQKPPGYVTIPDGNDTIDDLPAHVSFRIESTDSVAAEAGARDKQKTKKKKKLSSGYTQADIAFVAYHMGYMIFNFDLTRYAISHDLLSRKTGLDYELYVEWELVVLNTHLICCIVVFVQGYRASQKISFLPVKLMSTMLPLIGEMFDSLKDTTTGGIYYCAGGLIGWICLALVALGILLPCFFIYKDPATLKSLRESYWPALTARIVETSDDDNVTTISRRSVKRQGSSEEAEPSKQVFFWKIFDKAIDTAEELTRPHRQRIAVYEDGIQGCAGLLYTVCGQCSPFVILTSVLSLVRVGATVSLRPFILGFAAGRGKAWTHINASDVERAVRLKYACRWRDRFNTALDVADAADRDFSVRSAAVKAVADLIESPEVLNKSTEEERKGANNKLMRVVIVFLNDSSTQEFAKSHLEKHGIVEEDLKLFESVAKPLLNIEEDPVAFLKVVSSMRGQGALFLSTVELLLQHEDPKVKKSALNTLSSLGWVCQEQTIETVIGFLDDDNVQLRQVASRTLIDISVVCETDVAALVCQFTMAKQRGKDQVQTGLETLAGMTWKAAECLDRVLPLLNDDKDVDIRVAALDTISRMCKYRPKMSDDVLPMLKKLLRGHDKDIRGTLKVYSAIGMRALPAVHDILNLLSQDKELGQDCHIDIVRVLARFSPRAQHVIPDLIKQVDKFPDKRTTVMESIASSCVANSLVADALASFLSSNTELTARRYGLGAISRMGKAAGKHTSAILKCWSDDETREATSKALKSLATCGVYDPSHHAAVFMKSANDPVYQICTSVCEGLPLMGCDTLSSAETLLYTLEKNPDSCIKGSTVGSLGATYDQASWIVTQLRERYPKMKVDAKELVPKVVLALGKYEEAAMFLLVELMQSKDEALCDPAWSEFRNMDNDRYASCITKEVADLGGFGKTEVSSQTDEKRHAVLNFLAARPGRISGCIQTVANILSSDKPILVPVAIDALSQLGKDASPHIHKIGALIFENEDDSVRRAAILCLSRCGHVGFEEIKKIDLASNLVKDKWSSDAKSRNNLNETINALVEMAVSMEDLGIIHKLIPDLIKIANSEELSSDVRLTALKALRDFPDNNLNSKPSASLSRLLVNLATSAETVSTDIREYAVRTLVDRQVRITIDEDDGVDIALFKRLCSLLPEHLPRIVYAFAQLGNRLKDLRDILPYCVCLLKKQIVSSGDDGPGRASYQLLSLEKAGLIREGDVEIVHKLGTFGGASFFPVFLQAIQRTSGKDEELVKLIGLLLSAGKDVWAVKAMGELVDGDRFLEEVKLFTKHPDSSVRAGAARTISKLGGKASTLLEQLNEMLFDVNMFVRMEAMMALSLLIQKKVFAVRDIVGFDRHKLFSRLAKSSSVDNRCIVLSVMAVASFSDDGVLRELLDHPRASFRAGALLSFTSSSGGNIKGKLQLLFEPPSVSRKDKPLATTRIQRLCSDCDPLVRVALARAILSLKETMSGVPESVRALMLSFLVDMLADVDTVPSWLFSSGDYVHSKEDLAPWAAPATLTKVFLVEDHHFLEVKCACTDEIFIARNYDDSDMYDIYQFMHDLSELVLEKLGKDAGLAVTMLENLLKNGCRQPSRIRRVLSKLKKSR